MKVAFCITELNVGGAERCLTQLALGLPRPEFDPVVYSLGLAPPTGRDALVEQLCDARIPVHFLNATGARQALQVVRHLTRCWQNERPQLVQTFLFHANLMGRLAARRAGISRVVSGIRVAEQQRQWHLWADRLTEHWVQRHVCVSEDVARFSREIAKLDPAKVIVIGNGVELARFDSAEPIDLAQWNVPPDREVITYVGRLDVQKRVDWLLDLAPRLFEQLPRHDLLLVGDGPQRARLEASFQMSAWRDRVHWAGWRDDVPSILRASAMLVLPSAWEGMPNVVLEAMACRLPVVATATEGVDEVLGEGASEQVVEIDNPPGFVERVTMILRHNELAARLGAMNRARVERQFGYEAMVNNYANLFDLVRETEQVAFVQSKCGSSSGEQVRRE